MFTNLDGGLVNRQAVAKAVTKAAERAGLDASGLATHTGRRTAVTVLYAEAVAKELNGQPRKTLNWSSPAATLATLIA